MAGFECLALIVLTCLMFTLGFDECFVQLDDFVAIRFGSKYFLEGFPLQSFGEQMVLKEALSNSTQ